MTGAERDAVMRAFRKLARENYVNLGRHTSGKWWFTVDGTAEDLTPAEAAAVEKWLEEVS